MVVVITLVICSLLKSLGLLWANTKTFLISYGIRRIRSSCGGQQDGHGRFHSSSGGEVASHKLKRTERVPPDLVCSYGGIQAPPGLVHGSFRISSSFPQAVYCLYFFLLSLCFFFPQYVLRKYQRVNLLPSARFLTVYSLLSTQQQTKTNKQGKKKTAHKNNICISSGD